MNLAQPVRDRIVGAVFLLSLAGIALPMLFDGAGVADLPEVHVQPHAVVTAPVTPIAVTGKEWAFVGETKKMTTDHPLGPSPDGERSVLGDPLARPVDARSPTGRELPWTVQVGSFAALAAGEALCARLLGDGFHAYVTHGRGADKRPIIRVAVGPIVDRAEAERVRETLQQRYGLASILKKFDL